MAVMTPKLLVAAALVVTSVAALFDWRKGRIPNWVSLGLLPLGPVAYAVLMYGRRAPWGIPGALFGALLSLAGIALCALVPYVAFRFRIVGGGDVKVLATVGALLGPSPAISAELYAFLLAALYVPVRLAYQGRLLSTIYASTVAVASPLLPRARRRSLPDAVFEEIRLAPFIFVGTVVSLASSSLTARFAP
jgi:prepilin peptidase CpaA